MTLRTSPNRCCSLPRLRTLRLLRATAAAVLVVVAAPCLALSLEWAALWEEDLRFAQATAAEVHPNLFHSLSQDEWDAEFDQLISRLPTLSHVEVSVELARIVALVGDGHTRLTLPLGPGIDFMQGHSSTPAPHIEELIFRQLPVRFLLDAEGLHVRRIARKHGHALGGQIVAIGDMSVTEALDAVTPTIRRDNEMQLRHHLPMHLALPELLWARGVVPSMEAVPLRVKTVEGNTETVTLEPVDHGDLVDWVDFRDKRSKSLPLIQRHPDKKFWFTQLPDLDTVYLQFNEVQNEEEETLRDFSQRLSAFLGENDIQNLVVDLRNNRGGNQRLARPLLHAILCSSVNHTGHLFALVGRTTFSAAMTFALQLEKHTNVLFVGEPTGSTPNHYGDSRKHLLPHSGLTLRISTRFWQSHPTDQRPWIAPHIPIEITAADARMGRDRGVEIIVDLIKARATAEAASAPKGRWRGFTSPGLNSFELFMELSPEAGGTRIAVSIPDLELQFSSTAKDNRFLLEAAFQEEPLRMFGEVSGDWIVGQGDFRSVLFPFVLRRMEGE